MCDPCEIKVFQTETSVGGRKWSLLSDRCADCAIVIFRIFTGPQKQHIIYDMKTKFYTAIALAAVLLAASCSSGSDSESGTSTSAPETIEGTTASVPSETATTTSAPSGNVEEETSLVVPFTAANGSGTVAVSGDGSPVVAWFGGLPGEVSLDLVDADVGDAVSVVEELVSFWFFQDDDSGDVPPNVYVSASGDISDSVGTRYVVESSPLPAAPGTETTTTTTSAATSSPAASTTTSTSSPETSETTTAETTTTTTTTSAVPATTSPVTADLSPSQLQVQVLNGSGVAGAAGRLSASLRDAGYAVLPAGNAPERFATSAVYYVASEHRDEAELVAEVVAESVPSVSEEDVAVASLPASGQIPAGDANVVVLIGSDDLGGNLRTSERSSGLRRTPDYDTPLPLADDVPRDRYVPGLLDIQIFTEANDQGSDEMKGILNALSGWFNVAGRYQSQASRAAGNLAADLEEHMDYDYLQTQVWPNIERSLEWLGFTSQNVCGAPAGYSFTDLIKPTREFDPATQNYTGDAIFTTDRLIELHGGQRINPEANLDFYIRQAVQTAYDQLRVIELVSETETMQTILCVASTASEGEISEAANSLYYAGFISGVQPLESLLSQGTYHVKEISRNGNRVQIVVCHPTLGSRYIAVWWRDAGYRAEVTGSASLIGCQADFEQDDYISEHEDEPSFTFSFGERVFSAGDLQSFPRN